jgi:hypothetical protein
MIRLNEKGVRAFTSSAGSTHPSRADWQNRTGRIVRYNRTRTVAFVIWDGRRSPDQVPVNLIEPPSDAESPLKRAASQ